ncbi:MAG: DNA polymerase IV [Verrucomicrobiota bacterium]
MRKILHIDMDAFYASIEERDHPAWRGKPMAVGGRSRRGVLTTANYEARKFGCRSAMPVFQALERCPHLILAPVRFEVYRAESAKIRRIFHFFTPLVEPLSLDEAYLDVSALHSSGAAVAREIRYRIQEETGLTASAGIAPNKMLAKIASDWEKPDGQFELRPEEVEAFLRDLPVGKIHGVGRRMQEKLAALGVETCRDLQAFSRAELSQRFGKWGLELFERCRGVDQREVQPHRLRKSLSSERTFSENIETLAGLEAPFAKLLAEVRESREGKHRERALKGLVVKLKFADFSQTTVERASEVMEAGLYQALLAEAWSRGRGRAVRLLGLGVRFAEERSRQPEQLEMFSSSSLG